MIVGEAIAEDFDAVVGEDHHAGAGRDCAYDIALGGEVIDIVAVNFVVEDAGVATALHWQVRQVENQNASGVVRRDVIVDVGESGVLDLDACDIVFGAGVAHDNLARLAYVNARIGSADRDRAFNEDVLRLHRIDAIGAVGSERAASPLGSNIAYDHVFALIDF